MSQGKADWTSEEIVRQPGDIPITIINGWLGAGKSTIILNILAELSRRHDLEPVDSKQGSTESTESATLPNGNNDEGMTSDSSSAKPKASPYKVVWLKNEFGVNETDSLLANERSISSVKEILNGCLCCTLVRTLYSDTLGLPYLTVTGIISSHTPRYCEKYPPFSFYKMVDA